MAIPAALVTVFLESVEFLSPSVRVAMEVGERPYVLAWLGVRRFGRSRVIRDLDTPFTFAEERGRWTRELAVASGESIPLAIEVWTETLGDAPIARLDATIPPPWSLGTTRVVTGDLALTYRVVPRHVPAPSPPAVAPRSAAETASRATLRIPDTVVVELTDVVGIYEPVLSSAVGEPGSRRRVGYLSEDDQARAYRNRKLDGTFKADTQLVELHATVTVLRGFLPAGARMRWVVEDVDDPSNDDPSVHADGGSYIDRPDYDPNTGEHLGSNGFDNEGSFDRWPRFETVSPYSSEIINDGEARTMIIGGKSARRIHCPTSAGTTSPCTRRSSPTANTRVSARARGSSRCGIASTSSTSG